MKAALIVRKDKKELKRVDIGEAVFTIGRSRDCDLTLDDDLASRKHVELCCKHGFYKILILGSRNGTILNGQKLTASRELKDGDEMQIGSTQLKFVFDQKQVDADDDRTLMEPSLDAVNTVKNTVKQELVKPVAQAADNHEIAVKPRRKGRALRVILLVTLVIMVIALVAGFVFRDALQAAWLAHQKYQHAEELMHDGHWSEAITLNHDLLLYSRENRTYQDAYHESCRNYVMQIRTQADSQPGWDTLLQIRGILRDRSTELDDDGIATLKLIATTKEPLALTEANSAFDGGIAGLNSKFQAEGSNIMSLFSASHQGELHQMLAAYKALAEADQAWKSNRPNETASALAEVTPAYQRGCYSQITGDLAELSRQIRSQMSQANTLATQNEYDKAKKLLESLVGKAAWMKDFQAARLKLQEDGEKYYTGKVIESCFAHKPQDSAGWLRKLVEFQGRSKDNLNFEALFKVGTTAAFLAELTRCGLHPDQPANRKDYTDVLLVAANLGNFSDPQTANSFLGDTYFNWAVTSARAGQFANACYLALLAEKHGSRTAGSVFDDARSHLIPQMPVTLIASRVKDADLNISKGIQDEINSDMLGLLKTSLPAGINAVSEEEGKELSTNVLALKFEVGFTKYTSEYTQSIRQGSKEFPVYATVNNPAYQQAAQQVRVAQADLQQKQQNYNATAALAASARIISSQATAGAGLFGAVLNNVNTAVAANGVSDAQNAVNFAQNALAQAQANLANTPQQVQAAHDQLFTWNVYDHSTTFNAAYKLQISRRDSELWREAFNSTVKHTASSWSANPRINLDGQERELPDPANIETAITADLKKQIIAGYGGRETLLRQLKRAIIKCQQNNHAGSPSELQDALVGTEIRWWDYPYKDKNILCDNTLLTRFGDVIEIAAADQDQPSEPLSQADAGSSGNAAPK